MQDIEKLTREMEAAEAARKLLEDPILAGAFERLEAAYTAEWRDSAPAQHEEREAAWHMLRALTRLKQDIQNVVSGGSLAEHNLRAALKNVGKRN
jgi:hypothetical protein